MSAVLKSVKNQDYEVADLSLAAWGRKELNIAQTEMPGLMSIREEFAISPALRQGRVEPKSRWDTPLFLPLNRVDR